MDNDWQPFKCEHDNIADECEEICSYCKHDCGHHNWSSNNICYYDDCNCKGFDYNDEFDLEEMEGKWI